MILGVLSLLFRRGQVPIEDDELATLEREGARGYNYVASRGSKRARERLWFVLRTLALVLFGWYVAKWSAAGMMFFILYSAVITVVIDGLRYYLASRWVQSSHSREYRAEQMLHVARSVERGSQLRPAPRPRPQVLLTLLIAGGCSVVGLPALWYGLSSLGWIDADVVFGQTFMPLFMLVIGVGRIARAVAGIQYVKASTVGSRELCLNSDDALDVYALALLTSVLLAVGGPVAYLAPFLVLGVRIAYRGYVLWWMRQSLQLFSRHVYGASPKSSGGKSTNWDDEGDDEL
ncbi:MAG TPA: hypothetical protein VN259_15080 [Xanthomonadales bacterium]|nr:hypothetical protein [Xanthomonadales bacterium]